jgi:GNAT superfamily N-acetyltransferase
MIRIRPARADDFPRLNDIEQEADRLYATVGLDLVLDMPTASQERLRQGPVWVAVNDTDQPIGFALAGAIDDFALLDQLSVLPEQGRKGIGAALIRQAADWARREGHDALVLSTYRELAWNQPYYERQGFSEMPRSAWGKEIHAMWDAHVRLGHDPARRIIMWKRLS